MSGNPALEFEIGYSTLLSLEQFNSPEISVRERRIFFKKNNQLFELGYAAREEEYSTYLDAFRIMTQTFSVSNESQEKTFLPFVTRVINDTAKKVGGEK